MRSKEFLAEAEKNVAKKKIEAQLDNLNDKEINDLLALLNQSLEESNGGRFAGKSIYSTSNTNNKSNPTSKQEPKLKPKNDVKQYIDGLDKKEKETLKTVLQKEKKHRQDTGEKVTTPTKPSSTLKNILGGLLVTAVAAGIIGNIGGDKTPTSQANKSTATMQVQKSVEVPKVSASKIQAQDTFSIKGLKFGMSLDDVLKITKNQKDTEEYTGNDNDVNDMLYGRDSLAGFSIGGSEYWKASFYKGSLSMIALEISPDNYQDWVDKFTSKYGQPSIERNTVSNKMGYQDINERAEWNIGGATIAIKKYAGTFSEGAIYITGDKIWSQYAKDQEEEKSKQSKDF